MTHDTFSTGTILNGVVQHAHRRHDASYVYVVALRDSFAVRHDDRLVPHFSFSFFSSCGKLCFIFFIFHEQISKILWADAFTQPLVKVLDIPNRFKQYFIAPFAKTQARFW